VANSKRVALAFIVHVVADVRRDEVVACDAVRHEVRSQFGVRPNVRDAVRRVRIEVVGVVIEVDERVVPDRIGVAVRERANRAADVLLVSLPRDAGVVQKCHQVLCRALVVDARRIVIQDSEVCPGLKPQVVGQAGMDARRIEVLLRVRSHRKQRLVNVRSVFLSFDVGVTRPARPVVVLHQNDEERLDLVLLRLGRSGTLKRKPVDDAPAPCGARHTGAQRKQDRKGPDR